MELRIEIRTGSEPISGVVRVGDAAIAQEFIGWMGLVELIAEAVAEFDQSAPDRDGPR